MLDRDRSQVVVHDVLHVGAIAGLDSPDQAPDDAGGGDFGFETPGPAIVLALNRIERKPRHGRRAPVRAPGGHAITHDTGGRVFRDAKKHHVADVPRRTDPHLGHRGRRARRCRAVVHERPGISAPKCGQHRGGRGRVRAHGRDAEVGVSRASPSARACGRAVSANGRSDAIERLDRGGGKVRRRRRVGARAYLAIVAHRDGYCDRVPQLESQHEMSRHHRWPIAD